MKRGSIITKTIFQIFIYLIELLGVSFVITCLTHYFIEPVLSYMQLIERMLMSYTIYQILVVVILTNINDIVRDSYLAYITTLKYCLIYLESKNETIKAILLNIIDEQLDPGRFNILDTRKAYEYLKANLDILNVTQINLQLVEAEHSYETATLNWRYSFLLRLRIFK